MQNITQGSNHMEKDVQPWEWCCKDSKIYGNKYCEYYMEKRPPVSFDRYNKRALGKEPFQNISIDSMVLLHMNILLVLDPHL